MPDNDPLGGMLRIGQILDRMPSVIAILALIASDSADQTSRELARTAITLLETTDAR